MDVTRLEQRAYRDLWTLWGIHLKVYDYAHCGREASYYTQSEDMKEMI